MAFYIVLLESRVVLMVVEQGMTLILVHSVFILIVTLV